jgi:hypothetical protein
MINLMPPKHKEAIAYARRNTMLRRWILGVGVGALGIVLFAGGSLFYLKQDTENYRAQAMEAKTELQKQDESGTLQRVEEISGRLKLVVDVLSREVLFSKLLQQIGLVMPGGTILQDLRLSRELQGGLDLTVGAVSYNAATQVQVNLQDPSNGIFEKADMQNVTCSTAADAGPYPCQAQIRVLFIKDNNPFLLLNQSEDTP